jgi:hypothetical protein
MTPEQNQKKRRFRELAKHDRIRTGHQFAEAQPFLPLFNDIVTGVEEIQRQKKGVFRGNGQNPTRQDARTRVLMEGPL